MALTVEELRALLALVLGSANLVLLFLNRKLAAEQQAADKALMNLEVLQKQVCAHGAVVRATHSRLVHATSRAAAYACHCLARDQAKGLSAEYQRATSNSKDGSGDAATKAQVDKLIREKQALMVRAWVFVESECRPGRSARQLL